MKNTHTTVERGSVLLTALLTLTILTLICATSLYITSQNQNTGIQVAAWQGTLPGAEAGVDQAIRALNTGTWTGWYQMSETGTTLPTAEPSPTGSTASAAPDSSHYNLLPSSSFSLTYPTTEGTTSMSTWVVVDQGGMAAAQDTNNKQWYRIRATSYSPLNSPQRVSSNNRLDSDLRNTLSLRFNRKLGSTSQLGPSRSIEVIVSPVTAGGWARGITTKSWVSMSGGSSVIDSYNSGNYFYSAPTNYTYNGNTYTYGVYDSTKRGSHGDVGIVNTNGASDLRSTYIYGNLTYSGSAVKNTTNVQGTISTPYNGTVPDQSAPTWSPQVTYAGGGSSPPNGGVFNAGTKNNPAYVQVSGNLTISNGSNPLHIVQHDSSSGNQIYIWVTGNLTTSGSGYIYSDPNVQVTWYVGGSITVSGGSYQNKSGLASNNTIIGYGPSGTKATISGGSDWVGTLNVPNYSVTISGGGSLDGALIANTLTISGGSGLHYDEALGSGGGSAAVGNYAFASWFEDNAVANHKDRDGNYVIY